MQELMKAKAVPGVPRQSLAWAAWAAWALGRAPQITQVPLPKKVPAPAIPRLKAPRILPGRVTGKAMLTQAERWVEEFLEGSRMI